jgi:hypothetical protein
MIKFQVMVLEDELQNNKSKGIVQPPYFLSPTSLQINTIETLREGASGLRACFV